jgi:hypothetical protein
MNLYEKIKNKEPLYGVITTISAPNVSKIT